MTTCLRYEDVLGYVINGAPAWNGGAIFVDALPANGYYSIQVSRASVGVVVGLSGDPSGEDYAGIQHGLYFERGRAQVIENQALKGPIKAFSDAWTFHIVRRDNRVYYCYSTTTGGPYDDGLPGEVFYTSLLPSYGWVWLDASLFCEGDTILSAARGELPGSASGSFSFQGRAAASGYEDALGTFDFIGQASGGLISIASGDFRVSGLAAGYPYQIATGDFRLEGYARAGLRPVVAEVRGLFSLVGETGGSLVVPQGMDGVFRFAGQTSATAYGAAFGDFDLWGSATGYRPALQNYFDVVLRFTGAQSDAIFFREGLRVGATSDLSARAALLERVHLLAPLSVSCQTIMRLSDTLSLDDLVRSILEVDLFDELSLIDDSTTAVAAVLTLADQLHAVDRAATAGAVATTLLEVLTLRELARQIAELSLDEALDLADALTQAIQATLVSAETIALQDQLAYSVVMTFNESIDLDGLVTLPLAASFVLAETVRFNVALPGEGTYQAWVMNADTTGVTSYSNFQMDSLWVDPISGNPYGLTSTAIYQLEGTDDDGEPIDAIVATGDLDFGTSREKNCPRAYLYITQAGACVLKTITSIRGSRHETYYELADRTADGDDDNTYRRVPLGRGVRGVWWRFEIHNVDGSNFDLDGAEVLPVILSRRG